MNDLEMRRLSCIIQMGLKWNHMYPRIGWGDRGFTYREGDVETKPGKIGRY